MNSNSNPSVQITKEYLSDGTPVFVALSTSFDIASQGFTEQEAIENLEEALQLFMGEDVL